MVFVLGQEFQPVLDCTFLYDDRRGRMTYRFHVFSLEFIFLDGNVCISCVRLPSWLMEQRSCRRSHVCRMRFAYFALNSSANPFKRVGRCRTTEDELATKSSWKLLLVDRPVTYGNSKISCIGKHSRLEKPSNAPMYVVQEEYNRGEERPVEVINIQTQRHWQSETGQDNLSVS